MARRRRITQWPSRFISKADLNQHSPQHRGLKRLYLPGSHSPNGGNFREILQGFDVTHIAGQTRVTGEHGAAMHWTAEGRSTAGKYEFQAPLTVVVWFEPDTSGQQAWAKLIDKPHTVFAPPYDMFSIGKSSTANTYSIEYSDGTTQYTMNCSICWPPVPGLLMVLSQ